jgi:hypothetical protein
MLLTYGFATVFAAPPGSQYNPAETLDPSCFAGDINCSVDVSSDIEIGDSVISGTANRVLFLDGAGNLADNADFYYDTATPEFAVLLDDVVPGHTSGYMIGTTPFGSVGPASIHTDGTQMNFVATGDATGLSPELDTNTTMLGYSDGVGGISIGTFNSDEVNLVLTDSFTYQGNLELDNDSATLIFDDYSSDYTSEFYGDSAGMLIQHRDNTNLYDANLSLDFSDAAQLGITNATGSSSVDVRGDGLNINIDTGGGLSNFLVRDGSFNNVIEAYVNDKNISIGDTNGSANGTSLTVNDSAQQITFNFSAGSYSFPVGDGGIGQVLQTDGLGILSWGTVNESPITIGTSGDTLYSSALFGTGEGDVAVGHNIFLGRQAGQLASGAGYSNFLGYLAGTLATNASNSNFLGYNSGYQATNASFSNFLGQDAGQGAINATYSNFLGRNAGNAAAEAAYSNFLGWNAGQNATNAASSNFFGSQAGRNATNASASMFIGQNAGQNATNAANAVFVGNSAGFAAANASNSNFIGGEAGANATGLATSNFYGARAGRSAANASNSNFVGFQAGDNAANASNSIFIGNDAGREVVPVGLDNTGDPDDYSILIGNNTSTAGFENSIALGQRATNTASNQFMIGSSTRTIDETVIIGAGATECTITTGTGIACSSDETLKENIEDIEIDSVLDKLSNVRAVTYNWKNGSTEDQIGFLAQNLEEQFPELVRTNSNGKKSVFYSQITPILVTAIQALDARITELFNGVADLFVRTLRARDQICVGDTCIDEAQLLELLDENNVSSSSYEPVIEEQEEQPASEEVFESEEEIAEGQNESESEPEDSNEEIESVPQEELETNEQKSVENSDKKVVVVDEDESEDSAEEVEELEVADEEIIKEEAVVEEVEETSEPETKEEVPASIGE